MVNITNKTIVLNNYKVNNGSDLLATTSPLGSCGLFTVRGISILKTAEVTNDGQLHIKTLKDICMLGFSHEICRPHCLALDNKDNFEKYAHKIRKFLVQENEYFENPNGSETKLFIFDCNLIVEYLLEQELITGDDIPTYTPKEEFEEEYIDGEEIEDILNN